MKQKFVIMKDDKGKKLTIREHAELDRDDMSPICEETYDASAIKAAIKAGKEALMAAIRTNNLYPLGIYAEKIAESIIELYALKDKTSAELFFNDVDMLQAKEKAPEGDADLDEDSEPMDDLLEDEFEDKTEEKEILNTIDPGIKKGSSTRVDGDEMD